MLSKRKINKVKLLNNKKNFRLDKFIEMALFGNNGYYIRKKPIGRKFDFVTSPEISQMFGEIIGVYLLYNWKEKINSKFNLIELGPGNGTLFKDIERTAKILPNFFENANVNLIEINKELRKIQEKNLNYFRQSKIRWSKTEARPEFKIYKYSFILKNQTYTSLMLTKYNKYASDSHSF